jgi:protein TonB
MNPRVAATTVAVVLIHVALLAVALSPRSEPVPRPVESPPITAELLSPAPAAAPVAIQSVAPPPSQPPPPVQHVQHVQHVNPKAAPRPAPAPKASPQPLPEAAAPSPNAVAAAEPAPHAPAAPAAPAATAPAAQAIGRPTMAISAPQDISHLDCSIAKPDYPRSSQRRGESGTAYIRFVVGLTGGIEDIELKKSSGFGRLDDAALAAAHASTCRPYIENGAPMRVPTSVPFVFSLND